MEKKVPTSRLGRLTALAGLGLRAGASALAGRGEQRAAEEAAAVLGRLRGLAAKLGQMASYVDGIVPEGGRDAYEGALGALRSQAPRSTFASVRATVEADLGASLSACFATFEEAPIASASIGQVHRATLRSGEVVAVKVQHTGIREAVEADLGSLRVLDGLSKVLGAGRFEAGKVVDVFGARFREELDYAGEAARTEAFAALHAADPTIRIPKVFRELSGARVLTTAFVSGRTFEEACAASEGERRAWAETLWRFVFKGTLVGGRFNADPHPGNYLFGDDGVVTFLDHGCVQELSPGHLAEARAMHRAATAREEAAFRRHLGALIHARPGPLEEAAFAYTRVCFEPLFASPYRIERPWAASLVGAMKDMAELARAVPEEEFFNLPEEMIFMNRLQFGFYSVLARLAVSVDYGAVERAFLP